MIRLEDSRHLLWRNVYAPRPVMMARIAFGEEAGWNSSRLQPETAAAFRDALPGALEAAEPLDAPAFVAHIAERLQLLSDFTPPGWGVPSRDAGLATIFFSCMDPYLGAAVLNMSLRLANVATSQAASPQRLAQMLKNCTDVVAATGLFNSTRRMISSAESKGVPWFRVSAVSRHAIFGQGFRQQHVIDTVMGVESAIGRDYAKNKAMTMALLAHLRLPIGQVYLITDVASGLRLADAMGYPVVVKPSAGGQGKSVYVNLRNAAELRNVLEGLPLDQQQFLMQSYFPGEDHRLLVIDGRLVAAAQRTPASVVGDGARSIAELVTIANRDPRRIRGPLSRIPLDTDTDRILAQQGYARTTVLKTGERAKIRGTANMSTGGMCIDVTSLVHPDNARIAIRTAKALGLRVAGVDFICPDISKSWRETGGGICEVNSSVGIRVHAVANPDIDVGIPILETAYPKGDEGRIPTAMVTGMRGATKTCRMLGKILSAAGHTTGVATGVGVTIGDDEIVKGDHAGAVGASIALRDPTVTAAVLETSHAGMLRTGLYLDRCDVAALLDGGGDVEGLDELVALKRKVLDSARKAVVLNADDPSCVALIPEYAGTLRTILFSWDGTSAAIRYHRNNGGDALYLDDDGRVVIAKSGDAEALLRTDDLPATGNELVRDALAAAALAFALGIDVETISKGLTSYGKDLRPQSAQPVRNLEEAQ